MKTVLGLICSRRKSGNSETIVKEISRNIPEPHHLKLLRLPDFTLNHCLGCYKCLTNPTCVFDDDLLPVLQAIKEADGLIVASPVYVLGAHSSLRVLMDRTLAFYSHGASLYGKPAIAVALAGLPEKEGKAMLDLENFLLTLGADLKQREVIKATLPGEVVLDQDNMQLAKTMGQALFGDKNIDDSVPHCPLCGGETFRFLGQNRVACQLCSHRGTIEIVDGIPRFDVEISEHNIFLGGGALEEHYEWLLSMKQRFIENKEQLREVKKEYINDGSWVTPPPR